MVREGKEAMTHLCCELEILLATLAIGVAEGEIKLSINVAEIGAEGEVGDRLRTAKLAPSPSAKSFSFA